MFKNLNAEMARKGMRHKDLAAAIGVSERTIGLKLSGKREFTLSEIETISELFPNMELKYLFQRFDQIA